MMDSRSSTVERAYELARSGLFRNLTELRIRLRAEGFVAGDVTPEDVLAYLGGVGDPLRVERFHFDRAWMRGQGARIVRDKASRRTGRGLTLPARHLLVMRVLSGWMNILAQIDCTVAVRDLAQQWLPGFGAPSSP